MLLTLVDLIVNMRKLCKIFDNKSDGGTGSVMAADEQPKNFIGYVLLSHVLSILITGEKHVRQYVLRPRRLLLRKIHPSLLDYRPKLLPDASRCLDGLVKCRPRQIYGYGYDPGGQFIEWHCKFLDMVGVL